MRRAIAYLLLATYLIALYLLIWWLSVAVFVPIVGHDGRAIAHIVAALVIAFAMAPARGLSQSLADRTLCRRTPSRFPGHHESGGGDSALGHDPGRLA
jgi:hypothetical protein